MALDPNQVRLALSAAARMSGQLDREYRGWFVPQPDGEVPTLGGSPDLFRLNESSELHTQASRWLEYLKTELARWEARHVLYQADAKKISRRLVRSHGKNIDKWTPEELNELEDLEAKEAEAKARVILLHGITQSLEKVRNAASRAITAQRPSGGNVG